MYGKVKTSMYLVDDDEDDRVIFAEVLSGIDPSIPLKMLQSAEELSQLLCTDHLRLQDIIFLNVNMPRKNGLECLREIRNRTDNLGELRIIMFSTSKNPDTIALSRTLGADFYAVKPATVTDLELLIKKVLEINWGLNRTDRIFKLN